MRMYLGAPINSDFDLKPYYTSKFLNIQLSYYTDGRGLRRAAAVLCYCKENLKMTFEVLGR